MPKQRNASNARSQGIQTKSSVTWRPSGTKKQRSEVKKMGNKQSAIKRFNSNPIVEDEKQVEHFGTLIEIALQSIKRVIGRIV
jgi:hypothetical protein